MRVFVFIFLSTYLILGYGNDIKQVVSGDNSNTINNNSGKITIIYNVDETMNADFVEEAAPTIVRVARGYNEDFSRYQIILHNPNSTLRFADKTTLRWTSGMVLCRCARSPCAYTYKIKKNTKYIVQKDGKIDKFNFQVEPNDGSFDGFTTIASGNHLVLTRERKIRKNAR